MAANSATAKNSSKETAKENTEEMLELGTDLLDYLTEYARQKPEMAALWCLGVGFVLGWKLKPW